MSVLIEQIDRVEGCEDKHFGVVRHNGHQLEVILVGPYDRLVTLVGIDVLVEYELGKVISADIDLPVDDRSSGIFPDQGNQVVVDGTVHNETVIDDAASVIDVYIQNSADFLAVTSDDLAAKPKTGTRIRIIGKDLHVYPTFP
jgi:hypothetical protein